MVSQPPIKEIGDHKVKVARVSSSAKNVSLRIEVPHDDTRYVISVSYPQYRERSLPETSIDYVQKEKLPRDTNYLKQ